jgi:hypothetical protein
MALALHYSPLPTELSSVWPREKEHLQIGAKQTDAKEEGSSI